MRPPATFRFLRRAAREIEAADGWWRDNRPAAPDLLRDSLRHALELLRHHPEMGVRYEEARRPGVRRVHLGRVGYHLYYRVGTDATVEVLALWHESRGRGPGV